MPCAPPSARRVADLSGYHPIDLGVEAYRGIFARNDVDPAAVDDVIVGCVDAIGGQAGNIGRLTWLAAGYDEAVPGTTVDRQCGSSQQAISFGAQAIMSGTADLILAAGMQNMSQIPISSAMIVGEQFGFTSPTNESKRWLERYGDQEISQFRGAEMIAEQWDMSREEMEAVRVQQPPAGIHRDPGGAFRQRDHRGASGFKVDEGPRESTMEKLASLKPLVEGGRLTAALASQISDGIIGDPAGLRGRGQDPRPQAARPHPPHQLPRRRPGVHADRSRSPRPSTRWRRPA